MITVQRWERHKAKGQDKLYGMERKLLSANDDKTHRMRNGLEKAKKSFKKKL